MKYIILLITIFSSLTAQSQSSSFDEALKKSRKIEFPTEAEQSRAPGSTQQGAISEDGAFGQTYIRQTGFIARVSFDTRVSPKFAVKSLVADAAKYLAENKDAFGLNQNNLNLASAKVIALNDSIDILTIPLMIDGESVHDSFVEFSLLKVGADSVSLRSIYNKSYIGIDVQGSRAAVFNKDFFEKLTGIATITIVSTKKLIFPKYSENNVELFFASRVELLDPSSDERFSLIVSHDDQSILEAFSHRVYEDNLKGSVYRRSYLDQGKIEAPLDRTPVQISGSTLTTNARGDYAGNLVGDALISLNSNFVRIVDTLTGQTMSLRRTLISGESLVTATDNELRGLNAFSAIHRINKFVRRHLSAGNTSYLNQPLRMSINVAGSCNAYYDGNISMYRAGGSCANMAEVNDVIMHEWGHGLDDHTGRQVGITDGAYSEGIGDILASYYSADANMGTGFFTNQTRGIRSVDNTKRYPTNVVGEVHDDGLIIGGTFWDLRTALIARYGEIKGAYLAQEYFLKHLLTSDSYREAYNVVLTLDDNDGNPATRSPNFCLISAAFAKHGLSSQAACTDTGFENSYKTDSTAYLNILGVSDDTVELAMSTQLVDAKKGFLCLDGKVDCSNSKRINFDAEGTVEDRLIFSAKSPFAPTEHQFLMMVFTDKNENIVGARKLKIALH